MDTKLETTKQEGKEEVKPKVKPKLNRLAILAFLLSFISWVVGLLLFIVGLVLGFIALRQIKARRERGKVLAILAIVSGLWYFVYFCYHIKNLLDRYFSDKIFYEMWGQ